MDIIRFPPIRVSEVNTYILSSSPGFVAEHDQGKLEGALARIDNATCYKGLDDVFLIAAKYALAIGKSHSFSDANKRSGLAICLQYLALNDYELTLENDLLADAMVGLIIEEIDETQFANILYALWQQGTNS